MKKHFKLKLVFLLFIVMMMFLAGCNGKRKDFRDENVSSGKLEEEKITVKNRSEKIEEKKNRFQELSANVENLNEQYEILYANSDSYSVKKADVTRYLSSDKGTGRCDVLNGDIEIKVFLVDDIMSMWDEVKINNLKKGIETGNNRLIEEANKYGISLNIQTEFIPCKIDISVHDSPMGSIFRACSKAVNMPEEDIKRILPGMDIGKQVSSTGGIYEISAKEADTPEEDIEEEDVKIVPVFAVNEFARSHANTGFDSIILYGDDDVSSTYLHELLHVFGATDFYYDDSMREMVEKYFPNSIMNYGGIESVVDEFTAYLIGWIPEHTTEIDRFLEDLVLEADEKELRESKKMDGTSGYVTNHKMIGGLYTGNLEEGVPHGYGVFVWVNNGTTYEGNWKYGVKDGEGKIIFSNGETIVGTWKDDVWVENY